MDKINIHIFNDPIGFFMDKSIGFIHEIQKEGNLFLNTSIQKSKVDNEHVFNNLNKLLARNKEKKIRSVIFHSYHVENELDIARLTKAYPMYKINFVWIFWSHEYYQLPEFLPTLYQKFSRKFFYLKLLSFHLSYFLLFIQKRVKFPIYLGLENFKKSFENFDIFCSFIKGDYDIAMKDYPDSNFLFFSYLTLDDFPKISPEVNDEKNKDIMVGHNGSPTLNHYEILEYLKFNKIKKEIIVPISYGKARYSKSLIKRKNDFTELKICFLQNFLSREEYYNKIKNVGYFILNSECQQALGNIIFFLWIGAKVFLNESTSTYKTLKNMGFYVYNIDKNMSEELEMPLSPTKKKRNIKLIEELIEPENVKKSWFYILNLD